MFKFLTKLSVTAKYILTGVSIASGIAGILFLIGGASVLQILSAMFFASLIGGGIGAINGLSTPSSRW